MSHYSLKQLSHNLYQKFRVASNKELEKRIEILEKELQHLKDALLFQIKKRNNFD